MRDSVRDEPEGSGRRNLAVAGFVALLVLILAVLLLVTLIRGQ